MNVDKIIKAINLASYEEKKLIVPVEYLIELKNEIECLRNTIEAKNNVIKQQNIKINDLTSKLINQNVRHIDEYF